MEVAARIACAVAAIGLVSTATWAQDLPPSATLRSGLSSAPTRMRVPNPLPSSALREIPLPATLTSRRDLFRASPQTFAPTFDQPPLVDPRFLPCCLPFFGFVPVNPVDLVAIDPWWPPNSAVRRVAQLARPGFLRLLVEPAIAEVHIDGFYMGTVVELQRLVTLQPGPHRIELRADGYETVTFDVRIIPTRTITYRSDLQRIGPPAPPVSAAPPLPKTFYVIPNCYAGDKPPVRTALPLNCNIASLRTIPPTVADLRRTSPAR